VFITVIGHEPQQSVSAKISAEWRLVPSFLLPFYQRGPFSDLANSGRPKVNYQSVGQGAGVRQFILAPLILPPPFDEPISSADAAKVRPKALFSGLPLRARLPIAFNKACATQGLTHKHKVAMSPGTCEDWKQLNCFCRKTRVVQSPDEL